MSDLRKAAEAVLEAFDWDCSEPRNETLRERMGALRQALAQPEQMADKEKVAQWMIQKGYATGHGDTVEDLLKELEWQAAEREREACAKVCDEQAEKDGFEGCYANTCAEAIRARSEK